MHKCLLVITSQARAASVLWASSNFERQHPLRFCPQCIMADEEHGRAYWHLGHQLPGVWVCTKHLQPLLIESSPGSTTGGYFLPSPTASPAGCSSQVDGFFVGLSDTVERLCGSSQVNLEALRNHICLELEQAGVTQAGRALNETKLRQWLSMHLEALGSASFDMFDAFDSQRGTDAVAGVLGKRMAQHPFRWALLIACLRLEGAQMDPIVLALHKPSQRPLPGFKNYADSASPHMAFEAVSSGEEIRAIAYQAGVSRSVVQRWLKDPEVHQVWHLARRGRTRERHMTSIREALTSEPPSRHALRVRASAAYQWFQRNEPDVLETLLPERMVFQLPLWS
ncbi:MAG: TniQ family protein [Burkholderiaceae bacterium]